MDRIFGHGWKSLRSLVSTEQDNSLHHLPNCGTYALHEAYQKPVKRRRTYCAHDLRKICHNQDAIDRYISSLSAYCKHTSSSQNNNPIFIGSDYDLSLYLLQEACPNIHREENFELKKRQGTGVSLTPITPITTPVATTPIASNTGGSTAPTSQTTTPNAAPTSTAPTPTSPGSTTAPVLSSTGATSPGTSTPGTPSGTGATTNTATTARGSSAAASPSTGTARTTGAPNPGNSTNAIPQAAPAPPKVSSLPTFSAVTEVATFAMAASQKVTNPVAVIPTSTYSGQALLTATCAVPQYTALPLSDGSYQVAPIVGCAQANPECCPSLSAAEGAARPSVTQSIIPLNEANQQLVSALNSAPLTLCPADYTSTAGNCCPVGFSLYNQQLLAQTPCYSMLSTSLSVPPQVAAQVSSLSAIVAATATAATPTVSVHIITDQIFALSFPLKNGVEVVPKGNQGLSLGAKIGIGVGAGLGAIIAITLILWFIFYVRKDRRNRHNRTISNESDIAAWASQSGTATAMSQRKSLASTSTALASEPAWSPKQGPQRYADDEYGAGGESTWKPTQQEYVRMPPPRHNLQTMPTAPAAAQQGQGHTRYSELPAADVTYVEADGRERSPYENPSAQQAYSGQSSGRYELSGNTYGSVFSSGSPPASYEPQGSSNTTYYPPPQQRHELDSSPPPAAPRWMQ